MTSKVKSSMPSSSATSCTTSVSGKVCSIEMPSKAAETVGLNSRTWLGMVLSRSTNCSTKGTLGPMSGSSSAGKVISTGASSASIGRMKGSISRYTPSDKISDRLNSTNSGAKSISLILDSISTPKTMPL